MVDDGWCFTCRTTHEGSCKEHHLLAAVAEAQEDLAALNEVAVQNVERCCVLFHRWHAVQLAARKSNYWQRATTGREPFLAWCRGKVLPCCERCYRALPPDSQCHRCR